MGLFIITTTFALTTLGYGQEIEFGVIVRLLQLDLMTFLWDIGCCVAVAV
jgi:hypothetical protein